MRKNKKLVIFVAVVIVPIFCLALSVSGVLVGFLATSTTTADNGVSASGLSKAEVEAEVLNIAADYAIDNDLDTAYQRLEALNIPNPGQYVSFMVDRYIQEDRGLYDN